MVCVPGANPSPIAGGLTHAHPGTHSRLPLSLSAPAGRPTAFHTMTACAIAWAVALLLLPLLILLWLTETRAQRARRWRRDGWTQQRIADRLGCSRSTVRRMLQPVN